MVGGALNEDMKQLNDDTATYEEQLNQMREKIRRLEVSNHCTNSVSSTHALQRSTISKFPQP